MTPNHDAPLELAVLGRNGRVELHVSGELVTETVGDLRQTLEDLLARHPTEVVVEMAEVPFIDTAGVGVLVGLRKQFKARGISFRVANPGQNVHDVLKRMSLDSVFGLS